MANQLAEDDKSHIITKIQGHDQFFTDIATSFSSGRMHHAFLLTGPVGIGKATAARLVAAWLLSENLKQNIKSDKKALTVKFDPDDAGARLVFNGAHPDFLAIVPQVDDNKSGQIKVNQIRKLIPFLMHKPARGGWRVAIIDSMDEVNQNGANAMLKLLEEPPQQTVIFLITTRIQRLLPTIRSRCRLIRMSRLSKDDCLAILSRIRPDADASQLDILIKLSGGAPGQAFKLANSGAVDFYQQVCALIHNFPLDGASLTSICTKLLRGKTNGQEVRVGAVFCIDRLLRFAALQASGLQPGRLCNFEFPAVASLASRHSAAVLVQFHSEFVTDASKVEGLYLDFSQFLERHLTKICQKTLL